jgi:uncharacterized protein (DUF58 family)
MIFLLGVVFGQELLMILPAMVGALIAIATWWNRKALDNVSYTRRLHFRRGFPEEMIDLQIEVENKKLLPVSWLRIDDLWPEAVGPEGEGSLSPSHLPRTGLLTNVFTLRWFEKIRRTYSLRLRERGIYNLGPVRLDAGDMFGFFENSREIESDMYLTVFPKQVPFKEIPLPTDDPFGERKSRRRLYDDPTLPMGVRDYLPEDDFRRVHWPATARTGVLQSKVYQPVTARVAVICLNVSTFSRHWEGTNREMLEYAVGVTTSLLIHGIEEGFQIGLVSNGSLAKSDQAFRISPARTTRHLVAMLEALAAVTPLITAPFDRFLLKEVPRLPYVASLMLVTPVVNQALEETLLRLRKYNRRITMISLAAEKPRELPGIKIVHAPLPIRSPS